MSDRTKVSIATILTWLLLATSSALSQTWSQLVTVGSPPSGENVSNYDGANNRLIVFFPRNGTLASDEVWVLTNANGLGGTPTWLQLEPTGTAPTINIFTTAVYSKLGNKLIVYGGCSGNCGSALPDVCMCSPVPTVWEGRRRGQRARPTPTFREQITGLS